MSGENVWPNETNLTALFLSDAENLKSKDIEQYYNSVNLLGEFYNRLRQKSQPILIMGESLFEILTKQIRTETETVLSDPNREFDVRFARLVLAQVTLNGALARPYHAKEIETLFFEIRKCLIDVRDLSTSTKAFLLMTVDLYYSDFGGLSAALNKFYAQILDDYDSTEQREKKSKAPVDPASNESSTDSSFSLRNLRKDIDSLSRGLGAKVGKEASGSSTRINEEYLNRPLKASERLKYIQRNSNEGEQKRPAFRKRRSEERLYRPPSRHSNDGSRRRASQVVDDDENKPTIQKNPSNESISSEVDGSLSSKNSKMRSPLNAIATNQADDNTSPASPVSSSGTSKPGKFEQNFNWLEALENDANDINSMSDHKLETMSVISCTSNPVSPRGESSRNRGRRSSLNRFRSEYYKESTEDVNNPDFDRQSNRSVGRRSRRNYNNQQNFQHDNWRHSGRKSPRNDMRNGFSKQQNDFGKQQNDFGKQQNDFDRGGNRNDQNPMRRNSRGGSVDSNIKDVHGNGGNMKNRHDFYNRRNQENDNYDHYHSYNRKPHNRNKDTFSNLPPRLQRLQQAEQQKLPQMKQQHPQNNDCDNSSRYNSRNSQQKGKYVPKALLSAGGGSGANAEEGSIIIRRSVED